MTNALRTTIAYALIGVLALLAIIGGSAMGTMIGNDLIADINEANATKSTSSFTAADIIHQGWGEGDCTDDEWFDGSACLHLDILPAGDTRRNLIDYYYINN